MTIYSVGEEEFYRVSDAKKYMKQTGLKGYKTKVYTNGDWEFCGEISLKSSNRNHIVGTRNCNSY